MARIAGRSGRLYANITSAGTAEPIAFLTNWSLASTTNKLKVTAFGDTNEVYVSGLPDAQGAFTGWYDNATAQLYTAATDGVARKMYLYPDNSLTTQYFWGTAIFDFSIDIGVNDAATISGSFAAATTILKQG
jgi:hypothetical protein